MTEPHRDPSDLRIVTRAREREAASRNEMTRELERRWMEASARIKRQNLLIGIGVHAACFAVGMLIARLILGPRFRWWVFCVVYPLTSWITYRLRRHR